MPRVSVVMPVYNRERFLGEAIASILGQTYADLELIVVDDGSSDRSPDIISEYAARDARVVPVYLQQNVGRGAARNRGIERASGEYIAGMDSDDISLPDRLQRQVDFLDAQPEIGLVSAQVWIMRENEFWAYRPETVPTHPEIAWKLLFPPAAMHDNLLLLRAELLHAIGGYNPERMWADGIDLCFRLLPIARFVNMPDHLLIYRHHSQWASASDRQQIESARQEVFSAAVYGILGTGSEAAVTRLYRARKRAARFTARERVALRSDLQRLIEGMVGAGWVEADERPVLEAFAQSLLMRVTPRHRRYLQYMRHPRQHQQIARNLLQRYFGTR